MKIIFLALALLFSGTTVVFASDFTRKEKVLLGCTTVKWSHVSLVEVETANSKYYSLDVTHGARSRASVGAYLDSLTPVVFTGNGKNVSFTRKADGSFVLFAEFMGTQPLQVSAIRLVGKKVGDSLVVSLENAEPVTNEPDLKKTEASYRFFKERFEKYITTDKTVMGADNGELVCNSWIH